MAPMQNLLVRSTFRLFFLLLLGGSAQACAEEVELVGVLGSKAVLVVNGSKPRTLSLGERTRDGVKLLEVSVDAAVIEIDGRSRRVVLGGVPVRLAENDRTWAEVSLYEDWQGHHLANGTINGASVRFLVDTGASLVSLGAADAKRAGIDYRRGVPSRSQTASGPAKVWRVRLENVRVGDIVVQGVDGLVHENDLPFVLLGMSFLNRMDMRRDGDRLVLRRRY